jgi:Icc-related predicted phosphoesterase
LRICIVSDTHNRISRFKLPKADVLIHCGDWTLAGTYEEMRMFQKDLLNVRNLYKRVLLVPGNHDELAEKAPDVVKAMFNKINVDVLIDKAVKIEGVKFYGAPWVPACGFWSFQYDTPEEGKEHWDKIPADTDFLITHCPPHGVLDIANSKWANGHTGCLELGKRVTKLKPKYHAFGHIHEGYGMVGYAETTFINAASLKRDYVTQNNPVLLEMQVGG